MAESNDSESEVAQRYARAAFELAKDANALDALEKDFGVFGSAWLESADLREAMRSPLIHADDKSRAVVAVAYKLGLSTLACNLFGVIAKNGRAAELPAVAAHFRTLLARHRGATPIEIISAAPLDQASIDRIAAALAPTLGGKIDPTVRVDEALIGGFVVRAGSRQFDASIKTKLESLKTALKGA